MEFSNPFNSFNSYKGLLFRDQFDGIIQNRFLPPIEVNIDPCNNCNLHCIWCNNKDMIYRGRTVMMSTKHLMELVEFCKDWGVKAICFAGGGEPAMHPNLGDAFRKCTDVGLESALITNGLFKDNKQLEGVAENARWIGVSIDASTRETYKKCKGKDLFVEATNSIWKLKKYGAKEVNYKFLIHPYNQHEIADACGYAKQVGADGFHVRPVGFLSYQNKEEEYNLELINSQIDECFEKYESDKFHVYAVRHKYEQDLHRRIRFNKCKASPLLCMLEANGDVYVCIDRKGDQRVKLCEHADTMILRSMWGGQLHRELLDKINPKKDCGKCTMGIYQELLNAYKKDAFCMNFP